MVSRLKETKEGRKKKGERGRQDERSLKRVKIESRKNNSKRKDHCTKLRIPKKTQKDLLRKHVVKQKQNTYVTKEITSQN